MLDVFVARIAVGLAKPTAILATNTSSIRIEEIASELSSPERLIGIHFFNPVRQMPLVEVIKTDVVNKTIENATYDFVNKIGKLPLPVKSSPGFLVNAVLGLKQHLQEILDYS